MITIYEKEKYASVIFGDNGKANICIGTYEHGLILQEIKTGNKKVGDNLKDEDIQEAPKIIMEFYNTDSIDVIIKQLQRVKQNMEIAKYGSLAFAC